MQRVNITHGISPLSQIKPLITLTRTRTLVVVFVNSFALQVDDHSISTAVKLNTVHVIVHPLQCRGK